jgi:hypothetical protein
MKPATTATIGMAIAAAIRASFFPESETDLPSEGGPGGGVAGCDSGAAGGTAGVSPVEGGGTGGAPAPARTVAPAAAAGAAACTVAGAATID